MHDPHEVWQAVALVAGSALGTRLATLSASQDVVAPLMSSSFLIGATIVGAVASGPLPPCWRVEGLVRRQFRW